MAGFLAPDYSTRGSSAVAWDFLFHGQFEDVETGWQNNGYRYYVPWLGRWPSRDPISEIGGVNLYGFTGNNGINFTDYLGLYDYSPINEQIHEGGKDAMEAADKELKKRQGEYDALPPEQKVGKTRPQNRKEFCGRVCRKCDGNGNFSYYRTGPTEGWYGSCNVSNTPACEDGDTQVGIYHNHPGPGGLSEEDKETAREGKPGLKPPAGFPPGSLIGATRDLGRTPTTDIFNPHTGGRPERFTDDDF